MAVRGKVSRLVFPVFDRMLSTAKFTVKGLLVPDLPPPVVEMVMPLPALESEIESVLSCGLNG